MNSSELRTTLLFIILLFFPPLYSQNVNVDSPVFIGTVLIDKPDEEDMAETCRYYKMVEGEKEDDFSVFKADDGTKIRFKVVDSSPVVEVITKESVSSVRKKLEKAKFTRSGDGYIRGSGLSKRVTRCSVKASPTTLTFYKTKTR